MLPPFVGVPGTGMRSLRIVDTSGTVYWSTLPPCEADGSEYQFNSVDGTDIRSYDGISGIVHDTRAMFLVGVFCSSEEALDPSPPRQLMNEEAATGLEFSPLLNQTFFIGDGLTGHGSGQTQTFIAPDGATRLFLGFADAYAFGYPVSDPGWYSDNGGQLQVELTWVPEPSTSLVLVVAGWGMLLRRRR